MNPGTAPSIVPASRRLAPWIAGACALGVAWLLRGLIVSLLLAFLVAWALDPFVNRLAAAKVPRGVAAVAVLLALGGALVAVAGFAVPYFSEQLALVAAQLPDQLAAAQQRIEVLFWDRLHVRLPHTWAELATSLGQSVGKGGPDVLNGALSALFGTLDVIIVAAGSLLVPIFALWLLVEYDRVLGQARRLVPRRWAGLVASLAREIDQTLGGWLRGQAAACVVLATLYAVGLGVTGIKMAIPIGVMTGILAFVPYVGFGAGLSMALAMSLLDWHGIDVVAGVLVVMLVVQVLDALVITPRIVGKSVGLHPLEVLVAITAAGTLFGFLGVLLAVPLGAVTKIVLRRATRAYLRSSFYRTPPEGPYVTPLPVPVSERPRPVARAD